MSRYLTVLRTRGALIAFAASVVARLPISMVTLGAVLLVQGERGSYGLAGGITACFAIGSAVGTPFWGRLLDRFGQAPVLGPTSCVSAALLLVFALSVVGGAPTWVLVLLSLGEGLTYPPISPAMRGAWQALLQQEQDLQAAYALEAVAIEVVFVAGPLLLSLLLITTPPAVPMIVTAGLLAGGVLAYISSAASRSASAIVTDRTTARAAVRAQKVRGTGTTETPGTTGPAGPAQTPGTADAAETPGTAGAAGTPGTVGVAAGAGPAPSVHGEWPLRVPRVLIVLGIAAALAAGFGNVDVSVAATARGLLGNQALLGFLYLGVAGGSAAGGLWYGSRKWKGTDWRRLPVTLGTLACGLFVLCAFTAWMSGAKAAATLAVTLLLIVLLFLTGLSIAPSLIMQQNLIDQLSATDRRGEAQSWLNASLTAGGAAGTALAGVLVDLGGAPLSFAGAGAALTIAALVAYLARP